MDYLYCFNGYFESRIYFSCLNGLYRFDCLHWFLEDLIACIASWIGLDCLQRFDCGFVWNAGQSWFVCITSWIWLVCFDCLNWLCDAWAVSFVYAVSLICLGRLGCVCCPDCYVC